MSKKSILGQSYGSLKKGVEKLGYKTYLRTESESHPDFEANIYFSSCHGHSLQRLELKEENIFSDGEIGFIFSLDICVCVGV